MQDYDYYGDLTVPTPWSDGFGTVIDEIIIEPGVTSIGNDAFRNTVVKRVTIPGTVTSIGQQAFKDCDILERATLGDGVEKIGQNAFEGCRGLSYLSLGHSTKRIDKYAFEGVTELLDVHYHGTLEDFDGINMVQDYGYIDPLTSANVIYWTLEDGTLTVGRKLVSHYGDNTFELRPWDDWKDSIHEIVIEGDVESVPEGAFEGFEGLTDLTIRSNVGYIPIEKRAFADCVNLAHVTLEDVGTIGE